MTGMRETTVCWAPECANVVIIGGGTANGRPRRYCCVNCRVRAFRRAGGKAPTEPFPPLTADAGAETPVAGTPKRPPKGSKTPPVLDAAPPPPAPVTQLHVAVTEDSTIPVTIVVHPMVAQYKADLERMGISETRQGLHIVAMAEKLVSSATSASAATAVSKELERLMAVAEQNTPEAQVGRDPSVAIRERTLAKLRAVAG